MAGQPDENRSEADARSTAIYAALRAGVATHLVIDELTAMALIRRTDKQG